MNDAIAHPRFRATLLSVESIVDRSISAIATLVMAHYLASKRMDAFLFHAGVVTVIAALLIAFGLRRARNTGVVRNST